MKIPQNVYETILSFWSPTKTIVERDVIHMHWYVLEDIGLFHHCPTRRKSFMKAFLSLVPSWYKYHSLRDMYQYDFMVELARRKGKPGMQYLMCDEACPS